MSTIIQYISVIGAIQGLVLACLLLLSAKINQAGRLLGYWCIFLALYFLGHLIIKDGELNSFSIFIGWSYFLPASYGAFLYLYCSLALKNRQLNQYDWLYFTPAILCYVLNIDILFAPAHVKLDLITTSAPDSISFHLSQLILFSQALVYLALSIRWVHQYQKVSHNTLAHFHPKIFSWLNKLLLLFGVIWLLKAAPSLSGQYFVLSDIATCLIVLLIYSVAITQWRYPQLFQVEDITVKEQTIVSKHQTRDRILDSSTHQSLANELDKNMTCNQLFLNSELSLNELAKSTKISPHHISETLNQHLNKNFYQYVNQYRIDYFCQRLMADSSKTILDLAFESGFATKSTFNAVFKQIKGQTPSQFKAQINNSPQTIHSQKRPNRPNCT
ncbi:helix-turn-helix domain-containing protein [uncultured Paraglaciecola sp.]|uniref:helix-turn-helix domain-containing protein n=1 Tax=uncultured Paraglaciecola sp. TaxID=1765024 RepID=UPI0030D8D306|tara:strand:+ start:353186 stop:354346 length:1161 start_codon:yes stop_codon:yes gene_type:complete